MSEDHPRDRFDLVPDAAAETAFLDTWERGRLHHAWLLCGVEGTGKATFAYRAARRLLGAPPDPSYGVLGASPNHPVSRQIIARSHPDLMVLERFGEDGKPRKAIPVDEARKLGDFFSKSPASAPHRVAIIDAADDLNVNAANAVLKTLEEPPPRGVLLMVSHSPGRLLPTIRSRCRSLPFQALTDDAMTSILERKLPAMAEAERQSLARSAGGSAGRALALAGLDLAPLQGEALGLMREGDPTNARRAKLAAALGGRNSADRYAAFLELAPTLIAAEARRLEGSKRLRALDAYGEARELGRLAPRLSLDPATTAFRLGSILASVAEPSAAR